MARNLSQSRTAYVGEVGIEGTRLVRAGGVVHFDRSKIKDERLLPFIGEYVFCHGGDGDVDIYTVEWNMRHSLRDKPYGRAGKLLCRIKIF